MERIPRPVRRALGVSLAVASAAALVGAMSVDPGAARTSARASASSRVGVAIVTPANGARVSGAVRVAASASAKSGVARVEFRVDGALRWTSRSAPYVLNGDDGTWKTAALANGRHTLAATAYDRRGHSVRDINTVTIANPAPPALAPDPPEGSVPAPAPPPAAEPVPEPAPPAPAPMPADPLPAPPPASPPAPEPPASPPPVTPSVFLSPSGDDGASCSAAAPCRSLDRGYHVAAPGALVQLAAGSYPGGAITRDASKADATTRVVLAPAPGASVTVPDELMIGARHLELRDMALTGGWQTDANAIDVVMRNIDARHLFINSSQQVSVIGGRVGPTGPVNYHPQIDASTATPPRDILIDGVTFHDWRVAVPGQHTECLQIGGGDRITVRNSRFINCEATGNLHITHYGDPSPRTRNVTIENNFFSTTVNGYYAIQAYAVQNLLIRDNSATQGFLVMPFPGDTIATNNVRVVANLAPAAAWECVAGVQYRSNVFYWGTPGQQAAKCDASDTALSGTSNPGFVNPGSLDLHLTASSPAIGRGAATEATVTDIDGQARGASPDAGADQR